MTGWQRRADAAARRLAAVARRVRRATGPLVSNGSLALLYHRAAHENVDPWRLAVQPDHLSQHLEILAGISADHGSRPPACVREGPGAAPDHRGDLR